MLQPTPGILQPLCWEKTLSGPDSPSAPGKASQDQATSNSRGVKGNAMKVFQPRQPPGAVSALSTLNVQLPRALGC